jgi:hypothetical protein
MRIGQMIFLPALISAGLLLGGCTHASPGALAANSASSQPPPNRVLPHTFTRSFTSGGQKVRVDMEKHEMVIQLIGMEKFHDHSPLDDSALPQRLQIYVPLGWAVHTIVPEKSGYRAFVTPSSATNHSFDGSVEKLLDESETGYAPAFRASIPGTYNLMLTRIGQKGGHIVDLLVVSKRQLPAIQPLSL